MSDTTSSPQALEMTGVQVASLRNPSLVVVEGVNWSVQANDFWVVAGSQHSGKSDLLMHAAGLVAPRTGQCRVFGLDTGKFEETQISERLRTGFTFAGGKLFNQMTVAENVALPLRYHRNLPLTETAKVVEELLELLGLAQHAGAVPGNISPAWRQRAALARALILKPELLFLDNPDHGLTPVHRYWLLDFLAQLSHGHAYFGGHPMTIVVTTDDLRIWQHPARKFAALHEGRFCVLGKWGSPEFESNQAVKDLLSGNTPQPQPDPDESEPATLTSPEKPD